MRTLITNGTIVTADGSYRGRRPRSTARRSPRSGATWRPRGVTADETIDATGKYVIPGGIDVHTHMELPFGGTFAKDTFETGTRAAAFGGTTSIVDFAVQSQGHVAARGPRRLARQGRGQRRRRLRLPHDHERRQRRHAGRDGRAGRRGRPRLQAVHRLPGRLLQRRRRDLPGDAADREERRADHDARRERDGHRRRRGADRRGRHDRPDLPRRSPATRSSRARRRTASSAWPRRPACPSTSSTSRRATRWTRSAPRATAARRRSPRPARSTCSCRSTTWATGSRARSSSARRRCGPKDHWDELWTGLVKDDLQVVSTDHCPFDFHGQKELGRGDFRKIPNGLPGVEDRVDLLHDGGVVGGRISRERWVEIISTAPAKLFGMYPQKGAIAVGSDADLVVYDPNRRRTISAATHHMDVDYSCYEGRTRPGRAATSSCQRGSVVVRDGEFTGRKGHGRFIKRAPADFARLS